MEAMVVRASDRHRQLPSYLHSATIFSRDYLLAQMRQNWSFGSGAHIALLPFLREGWHFIPETRVTQWGLLRGAQDALEALVSV
jgi:hypothetical protein